MTAPRGLRHALGGRAFVSGPFGEPPSQPGVTSMLPAIGKVGLLALTLG